MDVMLFEYKSGQRALLRPRKEYYIKSQNCHPASLKATSKISFLFQHHQIVNSEKAVGNMHPCGYRVMFVIFKTEMCIVVELPCKS